MNEFIIPYMQDSAEIKSCSKWIFLLYLLLVKEALFTLRYNVLKLTYGRLSNQKIRVVNLFEIGEALGIEKEKLERIYFCLEDEGLIDSIALGGTFSITNKGKELIEQANINRIF
jgi:predicted transcriptional regulator